MQRVKESSTASTRSPASAGRRRTKEKKQTLQLIPSSATLKERLRLLGANPYVQITFKPSKPLSFIIDYVLRRRYGAHIAADDQKTVDIVFRASEKEWTREHRNTEMREVFASLKAPFRLAYSFDERVLLDGGLLAVGEGGSAAAFEARTRNATTVFDASNSMFGSSVFGNTGNGNSLGMFGTDNNSLQALLLGGVGGVGGGGPAAVVLPLEHDNNSFSSFLPSPPHSSLPFGSSHQHTFDAKRSLF